MKPIKKKWFVSASPKYHRRWPSVSIFTPRCNNILRDNTLRENILSTTKFVRVGLVLVSFFNFSVYSEPLVLCTYTFTIYIDYSDLFILMFYSQSRFDLSLSRTFVITITTIDWYCTPTKSTIHPYAPFLSKGWS